MSQRVLSCVMLLLFLTVLTVNAQITTLDPSQTVNLVTGEMGFYLPLGTVNGINGTSFPVGVNYKAGVQPSQEASAVGLGFSYGAGSICRKVVYVPDDNDGGAGSYSSMPDFPDCATAWWIYFIKALTFVIDYIASCISETVSISCIFSFFDLINTIYGPDDYLAGPTTSESYKPLNDKEHPELNGRGYFKESGYNRDMPDLYFVNTPFISGELVWCGDYNPARGRPARDGYFVFKDTKGGAKKDNRTIKVDYNVDEEKFVITLADGMRLFFEETQNGNTFYTKIFWQREPSSDIVCKSEPAQRQIQRVPEQWLLTKVLYPDYVDNGGDLDPTTKPDSAKGSWVVFNYKRTTPINARPLPTSFQIGLEVSGVTTPGSDPVAEGASIYQEVQLEWIRTPNQKTQYFYSPERLDNLWFKTNQMNWKPFERDALKPTPAASITANSGFSEPPYVKGLRLDSILIYSQVNDTLRSIRFKTDYTLKPGSFHSYSKDEDGRFVTDTGNPNAACLTLKSIEVSDKRDSKKYNTNFNYIESNDKAWDETQSNRPNGPNPVSYYVERKDLWGNFYLNTKSCNDFNAEGFYEKTEQTSYWSLNKIELPSGMSINWDYQSQRYDAANNLPVNDGSTYKRKFGGGIRVSKMTINDGVGKKIDRSYFYTDVIGDFFETNDNSSGHATVEPFPYLTAVDKDGNVTDPRKEKARGGYYTPSKVMYEMVQVVDGFDGRSDASYHAPNGFTAYEYITPKDNSTQETFINEGRYGEVDNSWKRGYLKKMSVYNRDKKLVSSVAHFYEFVEQHKKSDYKVLNLLDSMNCFLYEHRCGWVKPLKTETTINGVTTTTFQKYATDLNPKSPDYLHFSRKELQLFDASNPKQSFNNMTEFSRALTCRTKFLKGTDQANAAYDYILVRSNLPGMIWIAAGANVSEDSTSPLPSGSWTNGYSSQDGYDVPDLFIIGTGLFKMDNNPDDDLIVLASDHDVYLQPYLYVFVYHDIYVNGSNKVGWIGNASLTKVLLSTDDLNYVKNTGSSNGYYNHSGGSVIGNFYGESTKPDFLIFTSVKPAGQFPGDIVKESSNIPPYGRNIFAFTDFTEANPSGTKQMKLWRHGAAQPYKYFGDQGFLTDKDQDGINNDLVIVGPGCIETGGSLGMDDKRHVSYQIFKNIRFVEPNLVTFDSCSNCNDESNYILFNAKPNNLEGWQSTRFTGYYEEPNDIQKFVFFSEYGAKPYFRILNYLPVYYNGDYDGAPNRIYKENSTGSILLNSSIRAYWKYPGMGDASSVNNLHTLSQGCGSVTLKFPVGTTDDVLCGDLTSTVNKSKIVASAATTWAQTQGTNGPYLPVSNYNWKTDMDITGSTVTDYTQFDYTPNAANADWKLIDSICKYSENNQIKETAKPKVGTGRLFSSIVYGHKSILPTATVTNSRFDEGGVFTGDYDLNNDGIYFDKENGWGKGANNDDSLPIHESKVCEEAKHFGNKGIKVTNAFGPTRIFKLENGKDYVLTAWIKPIPIATSNPKSVPLERGNVMNVTFRKSNDSGATWPLQVYPNSTGNPEIQSTGTCKKTQHGDWYYVELPVPAKKDIIEAKWNQGYQYAVVWVGVPYGNGNNQTASVYIDDIRFYPKGALVSTTYYNDTLGLPILTIDANNNPGTKLTYDGFGRPVKWEKIDLSKNFGAADYATLIQEKKYSFIGEGLTVTSPKKGDKFGVGLPLPIAWTNEMDRKVKVSISDNNDPSKANWTVLYTQDPTPNVKDYTYTWPVIPVSTPDGNNYHIKVEDFSHPEVFDITEAFSINKGLFIYPQAGAVFEAGTAEEIRFHLYGASTIDIKVLVDGTVSLVYSAVPNNGSFIWNIPADFTSSHNVTIEISEGVYTFSSEHFTVEERRGFIRRTIFNLLNRIW